MSRRKKKAEGRQPQLVKTCSILSRNFLAEIPQLKIQSIYMVTFENHIKLQEHAGKKRGSKSWH